MSDLLLGHVNQCSIADHAPGEGSEMPSEAEAADHLSHLFCRVGCPDVVAMGDRTALEKADIAGEEDTVIRRRDPHELWIVQVVLVQRVEAQESEVPRQPTQVDIGDELDGLKGLRTHLDDWRDVD
jgi:hypothetical protein